MSLDGTWAWLHYEAVEADTFVFSDVEEPFSAVLTEPSVAVSATVVSSSGAISAQAVCPEECLGQAGGPAVVEDNLHSGRDGRDLPRQSLRAPHPASAARANGKPTIPMEIHVTEVYNPAFWYYLRPTLPPFRG
ncbi:uncharacterized protein LOC126285159 [Schistocerca gregaria]|uniref:uncharacterized protein LOC126285159 n=1 Tax=Schistocerca gregaria TaxID=7010 RepID=UPI00211ED204|nr:uncharacterized protein LOC126285159 [Schistocerca gregaria]